MNRFVGLCLSFALAVLLLAGSASNASAQCENGVCRQPVRTVVSGAAVAVGNVADRAVAVAAHVVAVPAQAVACAAQRVEARATCRSHHRSIRLRRCCR